MPAIPPLTIYSAESRIRHPFALVRDMWQGLLKSRDLAWRLMVRDISAQYRQALLGYFWAVFPPIVTTLTFVLLKGSNMLQLSVKGMPFLTYVFSGTVFWQLFVDALNAPLKMANDNRSMISKINLPQEALVLAGIGEALFSFAIKALLLVVVCAVTRVGCAWTVVLLPITLLEILLLGTVLGMLLIPVGMLYKDVQHGLLIITSLLVFLTPVAFSPDTGGLIGRLMRLNPVTPLLVSARRLLFAGDLTGLGAVAAMLAATLLVLAVGLALYRLALPIIIERIGS
jgi:lipopolysaccharide transport system permease protein